MKKKPNEIWWCVVNSVDTLIPHTIRCTKTESKRAWERVLQEKWKDLKKQGYKVVKISVQEIGD